MRFVDSSFWVALQFQRDVHHAEARVLWHDTSQALVTSNHVLGETWTFLRRRVSHAAARDFIDAAAALSRLTVHGVDAPAEQDAWDWLRRHDERAYSFVDACSFAVMRRLRLREALAFDGGFSAAGFVKIRP